MEEGNIEGHGKVQNGDAEEVEGLEVDGEKEVCCCGKQVVFFLLPNKTEWALVYSLEFL